MENNNVTPAYFISHVLRSTDIRYENARKSLTMQAAHICATLYEEEHSRLHITQWAITIACTTLCAEVEELSLEKHGLHFKATSATVEQMENTFMHELANKMQENAPHLWHLISALLDSRKDCRQRASTGNSNANARGSDHMDIYVEEEMDLGEFGGDDIGATAGEEGSMGEESEADSSIFEKQPRKRRHRAAARNPALLIIVCDI